LFVSYTLYPAKKKNKKKPQEKGKKKTDIISSTVKEDGLLEAIKLIAELFKLMMETAGGILRHTVISRLDARILVAGDDAAETAIE